MAHVIPSLRTARATYTPPAMRRKSDIPTGGGTAASSADFRSVLRGQSATTGSATASPAAVTSSPATTGTIPGIFMPKAAGTPAVVTTPAASYTPAKMAPTAESLFGPNPWCNGAGGTGPYGEYTYNNPTYFATPETAEKVAQMLGGKVVAMDAITPYGPFKQNQPNQMVKLPNGRMINAGLVAGFYNMGFTQQRVDSMIAAEVSGNGLYT